MDYSAEKCKYLLYLEFDVNDLVGRPTVEWRPYYQFMPAYQWPVAPGCFDNLQLPKTQIQMYIN